MSSLVLAPKICFMIFLSVPLLRQREGTTRSSTAMAHPLAILYGSETGTAQVRRKEHNSPRDCHILIRIRESTEHRTPASPGQHTVHLTKRSNLHLLVSNMISPFLRFSTVVACTYMNLQQWRPATPGTLVASPRWSTCKLHMNP